MSNMQTIHAIIASKGYAIGKAFFPFAQTRQIARQTAANPDQQLVRFHQALAQSVADLEQIISSGSGTIDEDSLNIFRIHIMMLEDEDYLSSIRSGITENGLVAEYCVQETASQFAATFERMDDAYMRARAADVWDISGRIIRKLTGAEVDPFQGLTEPVILVAEDLMPSQTVQLDPKKVLAFVTKGGSKSSHTAILAKTLGIPALVGVGEDYYKLSAGRYLVVDGFLGKVVINPDDTTLQRYRTVSATYREQREKLRDLIGQPSVSLDGIQVEVNANIAHLSDLELVHDNDAEGIGLFRSEFLYMESDDLPDEETQFRAYRKILSEMKGKQVIVRTLDLGADKQAPSLPLDREDNPAMGYRAIRICLDQREIFRTQITALLRASVYGRLAVMIPMIISEQEVLEVKQEVAMLQKKLTLKGIAFAPDILWGIMIETPAAAMISDRLAAHVDFFSIGTNDLTQYTLATDRMNAKIGSLYNPHHPAVLRLMHLTAQNAVKNGIWCGVCGESASDLSLIPLYMAMGISELSVTPISVLEVRNEIRKTNVKAIRSELLERLLST